MRLNPKILSIPPYISTSWKNVISLHIERRPHPVLVIGLVNSSVIEIPNLEPSILEAVFKAHEHFLEQEASNAGAPQPKGPMPIPFFQGNGEDPITLFTLPLRMQADMGNMLQHNSENADAPNLPREVLEKIATFAKAMGLENNENLPKAEPHCNCVHCQILRLLNGEEIPHEEEEEEIVSDEDLSFSDWEIKQSGENLYIVTNPLQKDEHYTVYLGSPVGCTCGKKDCEHIRFVLNN